MADLRTPEQMARIRVYFKIDGLERLAHASRDYADDHGYYLPDVAALAHAALTALEEVKKLASDPFASDAVALRACLLAAYDGLGLPGPEDSPEREIARAIIREARA